MEPTGPLPVGDSDAPSSAEREGRASDRLLRLALASARIGSWEWEAASDHVEWSEWVAPLFGISRDAFAGTLEAFLALIQREDRARIGAEIARHMDSGSSDFTLTYRTQWPDGSLHWIESKGHIYRDERGQPDRVAGTVEDVTERKQAEEALLSGETLLRQLIKHTPAAVAMFDDQLRYLQASDRWLNDYHLHGQDLIGRSHYEVFPDMPERWKQIHRRVLAGAVERCDEDPFPRADGTLEWLEWEVRPWYRADGGIGGLTMFTQVITERKRVAEALRASEERLHSAMQHSPIGMALVAPDGRWLDVNPALVEILGYMREELLRTDFQTITHPEDLDLDLENVRRILARRIGAYQMEKRFIHKDGRVIWAQLNVSGVFHPDGRLRHFISQIQDISERKRVEAALRTSEARLRRVVASPILGVAFSRSDGPVTDGNDEYLRIVGYTRAELAAGDVDFTRLTPPEYQAESGRISAELLQSGTARPREVELVRKDGARVPVLLGVSAVNDERSLEVAFVVDLTERRALERQLRHAQKMEAVGRLAAGVAHDFNNVLAAITLCSDHLRDALGADHGALEDVSEIGKAADRAVGLTRQLLAFSRQQVLEPRVLDLNELLRSLARLLRRLMGDDVAVEWRLGAGLGAVKADPGQLEQVIMNLAVNARDAMPKGGTLTIETSLARFTEPHVSGNDTPLAPGAYLVLAVSDTGVGMDDATRARLFEPFFTTKEIGKGTGLGLSTVYGIVRQSGGGIDVASELGGGSTFRVFLPRVDRPVESLMPGGVPRSIGGRETVLIAEDDAAVRQLTRKALVRLGYRVLEASDPAAAIELGKAYVGTIDLLLTDLVMPGLTGREVAAELKQRRPRLRVLYMSGYTGDAVIRDGVLDAGSAYIQKPFSSAALAHKLRALLDAR